MEGPECITVRIHRGARLGPAFCHMRVHAHTRTVLQSTTFLGRRLQPATCPPARFPLAAQARTGLALWLVLAGAPGGLLPTGPASVGEKLAAKQWGSRGERAGMSGAETGAGEPEGLGERGAKNHTPENQQRGVHHLTLPGRGWGGAEWQALSLHPLPGRLRHSAV